MSDELEFDIVEKPKEESREAEKTPKTVETPGIDVLEVLLSGKAIERTVETKRGTYRIRYPSGRDRFKIDQRRAMRRNGIPAESFDEYANYNNLIWSTLDVVIIDGPDWFKKAKAENSGWSWEECPDEEHVVDLYRLVGTFRGEVGKRIQESRLGEAPQRSGSTPAPAPVGDGAFQGLAYGPKS